MECAELTNHINSIKDRIKSFDGFLSGRESSGAKPIEESIGSLFKTELAETLNYFYLNQENYNRRIEGINDKRWQGVKLTKEEIIFYYDLGVRARLNNLENSDVFLMDEDKANISKVIGCKPEEIGNTETEALERPIKYLNDKLFLYNKTSAEGLMLPEIIRWSLNLEGLRSTEGLIPPKIVGGSLILNSLYAAEKLVVLPQIIGNNLELKDLTIAKGMVFPEVIGGKLNLDSLKSVEGLDLSHTRVDKVIIYDDNVREVAQKMFSHVSFVKSYR